MTEKKAGRERILGRQFDPGRRDPCSGDVLEVEAELPPRLTSVPSRAEESSPGKEKAK